LLKDKKVFRVLYVCALTFLMSSMIFTWQSIPVSYQADSGQPIYLHSEDSLVPIHMHSNDSLVPIHMHSNKTLTPVHMHFIGPPEADPIYEPICTFWHELYPEYCLEWHLTSWLDNGDGLLSACDQIDMTYEETGEVTWYHVDRITWTLLLSNPDNPEDTMAIEFKGPPEVDPIWEPVCTYWHEVYPNYCNVYHIVDMFPPEPPLEPCKNILLENLTGGELTEWHVDDVATDLILREKIADPICTWWHELYPEYCEEWHLTSWEDNGDGLLSPCDQIDMCNYASEEEMWDVFWSMGDVNRDGYINLTDLERIEKMFGWTGTPGGIPEDINSDGKVDVKDMLTCAQNQGVNFWAYFYKWYHVDRVTLTLNVTKEFEDEPILIEFKGSYEEMYAALSWPVQTTWHEVYPNYCNIYTLTWWDWMEDDNCNGVLDVCDYIWLLNGTTGIEERYHVDDICYDIILNKKIMDPRWTRYNPALWHEVYPDYCQEWRLTSWEELPDDPYPGRLSPDDQIDMNNTMTEEKRWYHVSRVTLTLKVYNPDLGEMYIEFKGPFEDIYLAKIKPVCTLWHQVWPSYSEVYHITNWTDNCNGVLDYCDYVQFDLTEDIWWHVEDLAIDVILTEKISDPVCTLWHELYPEFCLEYHIEEWEDNGDCLLSRCDNVSMKLQPEGPTERYHVETVTLTLHVTSDEPAEMYVELEIGDAPVEDALVCMTNPLYTFWHEVYPEFCVRYELTSWVDNCNSVLDHCDLISFDGGVTWWHVEEVAVDITVKQLIHDVAIIDVYSLYDWVYQGEFDPIKVTVENQGDFTETVDVTAYYNGNPAAPTQTVIMNPGDVQTLTFFWNTAGVPPGFYTVSATAVIPIDDDPLDNSMTGNVEEVRTMPWYVKSPYIDYAQSGMPDFDQKQDMWGPPSDPQIYTWCGPVAVANSLWWFDSEYEFIYNPNPVPPPTISDNFDLLTAYGLWDDHDVKNVDPFVRNLAWLMDTDGQRTGLTHLGTDFIDMEVGISQYLQQQGINPLGDCDGDGDVDDDDLAIIEAAMGTVPGTEDWNMAADVVIDNVINMADFNAAAANHGQVGMFYEHTEEFADFMWIEDEIKRCQDVVLFLEFWSYNEQTGEWTPLYQNPDLEAGHYVTCAGVNPTTFELLISDPYQDAFETVPGHPGRSPAPHPPHPGNPTVHNDAKYVSHDAYNVAFWMEPPPSPYLGISVWELLGYLQTMGYEPSWHAFIRAAVVTSPLGVHDVAVTNVTTSKDGCTPMPTVSQGYTAKVNVTVLNEGDYTESFTVTTYANSTIIGTQMVNDLVPAAQVTLAFIWDTTGFAWGNYTVSAYAWPVPGEVDTVDNTYVNGVVKVVIPGDVNGDDIVDIFDCVAVALAFGATPTSPNWNPNADINNDHLIDIFDIVIVALHFGETHS